nr:MFS transporter [Prescottella subtropica]
MLAVAGIVAALMQTLVVPLIGDLPRILDTTASDASWVITITLLVGAVATPVTGRLADLLGKRKMLLFCAVPLVVGSVLCALASSLLPMIVGRGLQGLGMGMVPLGISALRELVPPSETGSANSFNTLMRSVGTLVAAAVVGVVLAQMSMDIGGGHTVPTEAGFRTGMLIGCAVALVAAAVALAIPGRGSAATRAVPSEPVESVPARV